MTSVRIVNVDYYTNAPIPNLDVLNSEFRGSTISKVPIIRIFGSTKTGAKTCLHIHGVFPYIYIPYEGENDPNSAAYQLAIAIDKSINISLGQASSNHQHVFKVVLVSTIPFYGYHARKHQFLKIYFYNPLILKKATALLQNGSILGKVYQPHESHIPYTQQFMIDFNLHGMSFINLSEFKYRQNVNDLDSEEMPENQNQTLPPTIKRMSTCKLEIDASAENILNRLEISDGDMVNPGIQYIRDDEMQRRRNKGLDTQLEPLLTQNRVNIPPTFTDLKYKNLLTDKLSNKKLILTNPNPNASVYAAETPDDQNFLSASSILDHTHMDNIADLDATLTDPTIDLGEISAMADVSVLDEDANLLLEMLKDNESLEEDSILSQIAPKVDDDYESDSDKEIDLSLPLASITTPFKIMHDLEDVNNDDDDWKETFFDNTLKLPQLDGACDEDDFEVLGTNRSSRGISKILKAKQSQNCDKISDINFVSTVDMFQAEANPLIHDLVTETKSNGNVMPNSEGRIDDLHLKEILNKKATFDDIPRRVTRSRIKFPANANNISEGFSKEPINLLKASKANLRYSQKEEIVDSEQVNIEKNNNIDDIAIIFKDETILQANEKMRQTKCENDLKFSYSRSNDTKKLCEPTLTTKECGITVAERKQYFENQIDKQYNHKDAQESTIIQTTRNDDNNFFRKPRRSTRLVVCHSISDQNFLQTDKNAFNKKSQELALQITNKEINDSSTLQLGECISESKSHDPATILIPENISNEVISPSHGEKPIAVANNNISSCQSLMPSNSSESELCKITDETNSCIKEKVLAVPNLYKTKKKINFSGDSISYTNSRRSGRIANMKQIVLKEECSQESVKVNVIIDSEIRRFLVDFEKKGIDIAKTDNMQNIEIPLEGTSHLQNNTNSTQTNLTKDPQKLVENDKKISKRKACMTTSYYQSKRAKLLSINQSNKSSNCSNEDTSSIQTHENIDCNETELDSATNITDSENNDNCVTIDSCLKASNKRKVSKAAIKKLIAKNSCRKKSVNNKNGIISLVKPSKLPLKSPEIIQNKTSKIGNSKYISSPSKRNDVENELFNDIKIICENEPVNDEGIKKVLNLSPTRLVQKTSQKNGNIIMNLQKEDVAVAQALEDVLVAQGKEDAPVAQGKAVPVVQGKEDAPVSQEKDDIKTSVDHQTVVHSVQIKLTKNSIKANTNTDTNSNVLCGTKTETESTRKNKIESFGSALLGANLAILTKGNKCVKSNIHCVSAKTCVKNDLVSNSSIPKDGIKCNSAKTKYNIGYDANTIKSVQKDIIGTKTKFDRNSSENHLESDKDINNTRDILLDGQIKLESYKTTRCKNNVNKKYDVTDKIGYVQSKVCRNVKYSNSENCGDISDAQVVLPNNQTKLPEGSSKSTELRKAVTRKKAKIKTINFGRSEDVNSNLLDDQRKLSGGSFKNNEANGLQKVKSSKNARGKNKIRNLGSDVTDSLPENTKNLVDEICLTTPTTNFLPEVVTEKKARVKSKTRNLGSDESTSNLQYVLPENQINLTNGGYSAATAKSLGKSKTKKLGNYEDNTGKLQDILPKNLIKSTNEDYSEKTRSIGTNYANTINDLPGVASAMKLVVKNKKQIKFVCKGSKKIRSIGANSANPKRDLQRVINQKKSRVKNKTSNLGNDEQITSNRQDILPEKQIKLVNDGVYGKSGLLRQNGANSCHQEVEITKKSKLKIKTNNNLRNSEEISNLQDILPEKQVKVCEAGDSEEELHTNTISDVGEVVTQKKSSAATNTIKNTIINILTNLTTNAVENETVNFKTGILDNQGAVHATKLTNNTTNTESFNFENDTVFIPSPSQRELSQGITTSKSDLEKYVHIVSPIASEKEAIENSAEKVEPAIWARKKVEAKQTTNSHKGPERSDKGKTIITCKKTKLNVFNTKRLKDKLNLSDNTFKQNQCYVKLSPMKANHKLIREKSKTCNIKAAACSDEIKKCTLESNKYLASTDSNLITRAHKDISEITQDTNFSVENYYLDEKTGILVRAPENLLLDTPDKCKIETMRLESKSSEDMQNFETLISSTPEYIGTDEKEINAWPEFEVVPNFRTVSTTMTSPEFECYTKINTKVSVSKNSIPSMSLCSTEELTNGIILTNDLIHENTPVLNVNTTACRTCDDKYDSITDWLNGLEISKPSLFPNLENSEHKINSFDDSDDTIDFNLSEYAKDAGNFSAMIAATGMIITTTNEHAAQTRAITPMRDPNLPLVASLKQFSNEKAAFVDRKRLYKRNVFYDKLDLIPNPSNVQTALADPIYLSSESSEDDELVETFTEKYRKVYIKNDPACIASTNGQSVNCNNSTLFSKMEMNESNEMNSPFVKYGVYRRKNVIYPMENQKLMKIVTINFKNTVESRKHAKRPSARKNKALYQAIRKSVKNKIRIHKPAAISASDLIIPVSGDKINHSDIFDKVSGFGCRICSESFSNKWNQSRDNCKKHAVKFSNRKQKSIAKQATKEKKLLADHSITQYINKIMPLGRGPKFKCIARPDIDVDKRLIEGQKCEKELLKSELNFELDETDMKSSFCNTEWSMIPESQLHSTQEETNDIGFAIDEAKKIHVLSNVCLKDKRYISSQAEGSPNNNNMQDDTTDINYEVANELLNIYEEAELSLKLSNQNFLTPEFNNNLNEITNSGYLDLDDLLNNELSKFAAESDCLHQKNPHHMLKTPTMQNQRMPDSVLNTPEALYYQNNCRTAEHTCADDYHSRNKSPNFVAEFINLDNIKRTFEIEQVSEVDKKIPCNKEVTKDVVTSDFDYKKSGLYALTEKQKRSIDKFPKKSIELYNHILRKQERLIMKHNKELRLCVKNHNISSAMILKRMKRSLDKTDPRYLPPSDSEEDASAEPRNFTQLDGPVDSSSSDEEPEVNKQRKRKMTRKTSSVVGSPKKKCDMDKFPALAVRVQSPKKFFRNPYTVSNPLPSFSLNKKQTKEITIKQDLERPDCDIKETLTKQEQICDNKVPSKVKRVLKFIDLSLHDPDNTVVEEVISCGYTPNKLTPIITSEEDSKHLNKINISKLSQLNLSANVNVEPNIELSQNSMNKECSRLSEISKSNVHKIVNAEELVDISLPLELSLQTKLSQAPLSNLSDVSYDSCDLFSPGGINTGVNEILLQTETSSICQENRTLEQDIAFTEGNGIIAPQSINQQNALILSRNQQDSSKFIYLTEADRDLTTVEKYDLLKKIVPLAGSSRIDDTCSSIQLNLQLSLSPKPSGSSSDFSITPYQNNQTEIATIETTSLSPKSNLKSTKYRAISQTINSGTKTPDSLPNLTTDDDSSKYEYFLNQSIQLTNYDFKTQNSINNENDLDVTLTEQRLDGICVVMPKFNPPTREYIESTIPQFNLPFVRNQDPFYSDFNDVTGNVDVGPNVLKISSKTVADLPEFESNFSGISAKQKQEIRAIHPNFTKKELVNIKLSHCSSEECILEPIKCPPSRRDVELWIKAKAILKEKPLVIARPERIKIMIPCSPNSRLDDSFDETLTLSPCSPHELRMENIQDERSNSCLISSENSSESVDIRSISDLSKSEKTAKPSILDYNEDSRHGLKSPPFNEAPLSPILTKSLKRRRASKNKSIAKSLTPKFDQISDANQSTDDSLRKILLQSHLFNKSGSFSNTGQITGATLNDTHGFKMSLQNLQQVRCVTEHQYLTTLVIELHLQTRGDFKPNPEFDAIQAIFYSILNDVPEDYHQPRNETGIFVVNSQFLSPTKSKIKTDVLHGTGVNCDIIYVDTEIDLIPKFIDFIRKWDPDICIGYEIEMLSWGYLIERCFTLGINIIPQLSRIIDVQVQRKNPDEELHTELKIPGRIVLDFWRLLKHEVALLSYTFENVVYHILHERVPMYTFKDLTNWWVHRNPKFRHRTVDYYMYRVKGTLKLIDHLDFIGRTSELARLFGIQFYEVLSRGSQFRVESMMLRLAKPQNYVPVSPSVQQRAKMRAPEYLPLILEPESKFYKDPVIVLDFQSLYPSIIIAYNYCFSTCIGKVEHLGTDLSFEFGATQFKISKARIQQLMRRNQLTFSPSGVGFVKKDVRLGIMPRMLQEIIDTRLLVKKAMKDDRDNKVLQRVLHSRQLGLKLIANVTYGYTAANFSGRMPAVELGDSVVAKARETLQRAINLVENTPAWRAKVVYGDTDSLFVLIPGRSKEEAFKIGAEIADGVTNANPSPIRLKLEKVYQPCILQTKKRYVGYMYESPGQKEPEFQAKGIETVRRDGCPAVSKMLEKCLRLLFDVRDVSLIRKYVLRQFNKVLAGNVSIQDLTFAKEFRGAAGYKPGACVPALELARKWKAVDKRNEPRNGERVPYIIVHGPPGLPLIRLVRSPRELLADPTLRPNALYYITKVIIPPLNRCFKLIGCDMNTWFNEMPRKQLQYLPTSSPSKGRKTTIAQYFVTTNCACCSNQTKTGLCESCEENSQQSVVILHERVREWERNYNETNKICQTCCNRPSIINDCISLDCPVLYKMVQTNRALQQATYVREIISNLPELEF